MLLLVLPIHSRNLRSLAGTKVELFFNKVVSFNIYSRSYCDRCRILSICDYV